MILSNPVVVMGIPGSGKSTLCHHLKKANKGYDLLEEPLPRKITESLKGFYEDPQANTITTQLEFIDSWVEAFDKRYSPVTRLARYPKFLRPLASKVMMAESMLYPPSSLIVDASPLSILYHTHTARDMGWLDNDGLVAVMSYYDAMRSYWEAYLPSEVLYNKVTPEVALDRIATRGRSFEKSISLEYLTKLMTNLEELLSTMENVTVIQTEGSSYGPSAGSDCGFCDDKEFTIHEHLSHGKVEANRVFECGFCSN